METYNVKFDSLDEIREFNEIASRSNSLIDVTYRRTMVDGKSFLGLMIMGIGSILKVTSNVHDEEFAMGISKFCVAG